MRKTLLALGLVLLFAVPGLRGQTPVPTVHVVLFYSPTCGHCHQLINEHLIPMQDEYGRSLVILAMNTSEPFANNLYYETIRHFEIPEDDWVVPMMIIGDEVLIGGLTIPARLTRAMEEDLLAGGIDLPNYPALVRLLQEQDALDPRFPGRLIIRQDPTATGASDSVPEEAEVVTPDSIPGDERPDGGADPEREGGIEAEPESSADSVAVPAAAPVADTSEGAEGQGVVESGSDDLPPARPESEDPAISDVGPGETDSIALGETAGEAVDEGVRDPVDDPVDDPVGDPGAPVPGSLDLSVTARDLESMGPWERFNLDRQGNSLSVLVLLGMIVSLALRGYPRRPGPSPWPGWLVPVLVLGGAAVALYLSFIEVTQTEAVCGPVGDCNTVNQSPYATLFGFLPVGVLGLIGYALILVLWLVHRMTSGDLHRNSAVGLWLLALLGTLFSVYLTFLEPFVIGATCIWCLSSAVIMTLLLWATAPLAAEAFAGGETSSGDTENAHV